MTAFTKPRRPLIRDAMQIGAHWCQGRRIDGGVAFGHGCRVALCIDRFWPDAPEQWHATALVHDLPEFIVDQEGAPDRDRVRDEIVPKLGEDVLSYVWGLWDDHQIYETCDRNPGIAVSHVDELAATNLPLLCIMAADQLVSFTNVKRRLRRVRQQGGTEAKFWGERTNLLERMTYFRLFHAAAIAHVPPAMSQRWARYLYQIPSAAEHDRSILK